MSRTRGTRARRRSGSRAGTAASAVGVAAAVAVVAFAAVAALSHADRPTAAPPEPPPCVVSAPGAGRMTLDREQAANVTTIAAVARRVGASDHAVTVALATAMQESMLRNLPYGDRDSLGLFQQRPSQGWGTRQQVRTPSYAAAMFYRHLDQVPGWDDLPVTVAAQAVQRSAYPDAYAKHEADARLLARATTGQLAAALTCTAASTPAPPRTDDARRALAAEMGRTALRSSGDRAWTAATWLVARAGTYGLTSVTADGQRWTAQTGTWTADPAAGPGLTLG